jgi:hypothetical protein
VIMCSIRTEDPDADADQVPDFWPE